MLSVVIKSQERGRSLPHVWKTCVGSCHAYTALRADFQEQLKLCRKELGFQYLRFHGIFNDEMSVCKVRKGVVEYHFHNVDVIYDFLLSIGMKPVVELGFMPKALASGSQMLFHYKANVTPPADYESWRNLVRAFVRHLTVRYGAQEVSTWFFEVWNEPNLSDFWAGDQDEYFKLYETSARAIKSINPNYKVGGPATAKNAWISDLRMFCQKNNVPLDFVSTHHYPTDTALSNDIDEYALYRGTKRGCLTRMAERARQQAGELPLFYTEWNTSPDCTDSLHDQLYAASFIAKTTLDNASLVDLYSYWTFSDIFEEFGQSSRPFHGGFGLLNIHGIKKPSYLVYQLLNRLYDRILPLTWDGLCGTVDVYATGDDLGNIRTLVVNHDVPGAAIEEQRIRLVWDACKAESVSVTRIDETVCAYNAWETMGKPEELSKAQVDELKKTATLRTETIPVQQMAGKSLLEITVKPYSVVLVEISNK